MNTSESIQALRRANPRARADFASSVDAIAVAARAEIVAVTAEDAAPRSVRRSARRRILGVSAVGASLTAAAAVVAALTVGSTGGGPGVENAVAAVNKAAKASAVSAERSGTAVVRITHDGKLWAGATIRWNGGDLALSQDAPHRRRAGSGMLLVDGLLYGVDEPARGWVILGSPESIDPGSGTTPGEVLAAVRLDVGGATLRRIAAGMTGLTTTRVDGETIYSGRIAAGLIAREKGFKEGKEIRVLPFGYVAHDEAADPAALVEAAVKVGPNGLVREITVRWGTGASAWTYTVSYRNLGSTAAPLAPANARPLRERFPPG